MGNKFVSWWQGLTKWAKVGICAGTTAVLATAITLPIVLTQKKATEPSKDGGTYQCPYYKNDRYRTEPITLKKGYSYKIVCEISNSHNPTDFRLTNSDESTWYKFSNPKLDGAPGNDWKWFTGREGEWYSGSPITSGTITMSFTAEENIDNAFATFICFAE